VHEFARANGRTGLALTTDAAEAIVRHAWPYNVREILSFVRGFVAMASGPALDVAYLERHHPDLLAEFRGAGVDESDSPREPKRDATDRLRFESLLAKHRGNVSGIADEIRMTRTNVYRKLKALGLDPNRYRP
jgi:two-component system nitrogen regulation response regulator NtrX